MILSLQTLETKIHSVSEFITPLARGRVSNGLHLSIKMDFDFALIHIATEHVKVPTRKLGAC